MIINCTLDTTITTGQQPFQCDIPYLTQITNGADIYYVNSMWSAEGLFISLLMVVLIIMIIGKSIFNFFFPRVVKIQKK